MNNRHTFRIVGLPSVRAGIGVPTMSATPAGLSPCAPLGHGTLADLLCMLGIDTLITPDEANAASQMVLRLRQVPAGDHLIHMGAPSEALYFVRTGTFKISRTDEEGHEQVQAFAGCKDIVGFDALCMDTYPTAAIALEDSAVYVVHKSDLLDLSRAVPAFGLELQRAGSRALTRTTALLDVMSAVLAEVRLARFLLQMSCQMAAAGQSPRRFHLLMGRRDIARALGVAHETVSRSFTALAIAHFIHVDGRNVEILDMDGLKVHSRSTRRSQDDLGTPSARLQAQQRRSAFIPMGLSSLAA
ncbi:Crp/Fnr family transcriptional regulator [Hydrogenophaga sp.]|uniref:Crp/Fnr family transcriptional regulator n=1 Tax=Hydrogenophaga sp. TaxID=1904254 RepID=UPI0025C66FEA|nr:Crp/Fnr family transcriptional regulator [Hydrogenophaga sp.]